MLSVISQLRSASSVVCLTGRIHAMRDSAAELHDLQGEGVKILAVANSRYKNVFCPIVAVIKNVKLCWSLPTPSTFLPCQLSSPLHQCLLGLGHSDGEASFRHAMRRLAAAVWWSEQHDHLVHLLDPDILSVLTTVMLQQASIYSSPLMYMDVLLHLT